MSALSLQVRNQERTPERNCGTHFYAAALPGERSSGVSPAEGLGHGGVEVRHELLDPGLEHFLAGEVAAADELSRQDCKPDFDLIEP